MTAPLWTSAEAKTATGGRAETAWSASGVTIDSRAITPGDLFIAIRGETHDGHAFVGDALAKGAAAAVVDHLPNGAAADAPLLIVDDTDRALAALGAFARQRTGARIVAVTGSVGKTGVKEALRTVLAEQGATVATEGNLNNHWGLPLSLARMPRNTAYGVFEMGMNHAGELIPLSQAARPHVAVITTIEPVHIEFFGGLEAIADAKAEVFAGMAAGGTAVLNRDNPQFDRLRAAAAARGLAVVGFGAHAEAECRLIDGRLHEDGSDVEARLRGRTLAYRIGCPGRHWVQNSLAVLAAAEALGADVVQAAASLAQVTPTKGRGRRHCVAVVGGSFLVIDDSYNASPASMRAAFATLATSRPGPGGRRIAVLGDMLELGAEGPAYHAALATDLDEAGIDLVFTAGTLMHHLWDALPPPRRGGHAADSQRLAPLAQSAARAGDVVLIKGSAGSRMGRVVEALIGQNTAPARVANGG